VCGKVDVTVTKRIRKYKYYTLCVALTMLAVNKNQFHCVDSCAIIYSGMALGKAFVNVDNSRCTRSEVFFSCKRLVG